MSDPQELVKEFHRAFDMPVRTAPIAQPPESELRKTLIKEEAKEYFDAVDDDDVYGVAQELADIVYVAYGAALAHGIDLNAVIEEVHRANMSKLDEDGRPIYREDGKVLKSKLFVPADIESVVDAQR